LVRSGKTCNKKVIEDGILTEVTPLRKKIMAARWLVFLGAGLSLGVLLHFYRHPVLIPLDQILKRALALPADRGFFLAFSSSLVVILGTFLFSLLTGCLLGFAMWQKKALRDSLAPLLQAYYAIPSFALYPVFVGLLGMNVLPIILTGWLFSFPAIALNVATGLLEVPGVYVKVGQSLSLSSGRMFFKVYLPASVPHWFTGFKLGFCYCLIAILASEFILSVSGVGRWLSDSFTGFEFENLYAGMFIVLIMAAVIVLILTWYEARFYRRWSMR
jgi:NitT/TauT family transport system permease protein